MVTMAKYVVRIKERKSPILVTAKNVRSAKSWVKKMGLTAKKVEKIYEFK